MKKITIEISDDATNGDVVKLLFPQAQIKQSLDVIEVCFDRGLDEDHEFWIDWWNAPYNNLVR